MIKHRNSQKRFYDQDFVYFVTVKTHENFPYFQEKILCDLWIEELKICKELKKFKLFTFCLLSNHFHLLVQPSENKNISKVMQRLKRDFSINANKILGNVRFRPSPNEGAKLLSHKNNKTMDSESEKAIFRLRERRNFEKNILEPLQQQFLKKYGSNQNKFPIFRWQKSFHDHVIRDERDIENHFEYTENNFLKHDLPNDWKYTSLHFPELVDSIE